MLNPFKPLEMIKAEVFTSMPTQFRKKSRTAWQHMRLLRGLIRAHASERKDPSIADDEFKFEVLGERRHSDGQAFYD